MDLNTTPTSSHPSSPSRPLPLWQTLSSSFSLQRRGGDEPKSEPARYSSSRGLTTPLPPLSVFDRNPQIVVGVLLKNVGLAWRPRLFVLQEGVLKYYKVYGPNAVNVYQVLESLRQQGEIFTVGAEVSVLEAESAPKTRSVGPRTSVSPSPLPPARMEVHMQVGSVRESGADGRKMYVHSGTSTLTLRAETQDDRWVWVQALRVAKGAWDGLTPVAASALRRTFTPAAAQLAGQEGSHASRLAEARRRLAELGASAAAVNYVMQLLEEEHGRILEVAEAGEAKRRALLEVVYQLEDEKRQLETALVVEGQTRSRPAAASSSSPEEDGSGRAEVDGSMAGDGEEGESGAEEEDEFFECEAMSIHSRSSSAADLASLDELPPPPSQQLESPPSSPTPPGPDWLATEPDPPPRRDRLPPPQQKERSVSLWSLIKEMVGKDLTRVCLPVYFNEPLSALQKSAEDLEYSELLDQAVSYPPGSIERLLHVTAFAVSAYSSTVGRTAKPFNPLLGETYEMVYPEKGFRFVAEKVSHHPTIIAAAAEGRGWRMAADAEVKSRFWGRSIELRPEGVLRLDFDDGDSYAWNKVTTSINNLVLGKIYIDHGGIMKVRNLVEGGLAARVRFKETGMLFDKDPRQVRGFLERDGQRLDRPVLHGHWDDALFAETESGHTVELWRKSPPPPDPTRYNLTGFSIQLNELTPGLREMVAPTDCRLRPDQAYTEQGMWDEANMEKQRLEHKQRAARKAADAGEPLRPRWFEVLPAAHEGKRRGPNALAFKYKGGYWEARARGSWEGCRDIFGPHVHEA